MNSTTAPTQVRATCDTTDHTGKVIVVPAGSIGRIMEVFEDSGNIEFTVGRQTVVLNIAHDDNSVEVV